MKPGDIVKSRAKGKRFMVVPNTRHKELPYVALMDCNNQLLPLRYARPQDLVYCDRDRLTPCSLPFAELLKHVVK